MTKRKPVKAKTKKSKSKTLVLYVEDCSLKGKTFSSSDSAYDFVEKFQKKYPYNDGNGDNWIDLVVTDIKGRIVTIDPSMKVT